LIEHFKRNYWLVKAATTDLVISCSECLVAENLGATEILLLQNGQGAIRSLPRVIY